MAEINGTSGKLKWFGWFLALNLAWLLLAALTAWLEWRSYTLSVNGEVVTGVVARLYEDDRTSFVSDIYPIVEFNLDGTTYSVRSQNGYRWWNRYTRFPIGAEVEMRYSPADPQTAEVNSLWDIWVETILLGVFTFLAAIGVNVYLLFRWRKTQVSV